MIAEEVLGRNVHAATSNETSTLPEEATDTGSSAATSEYVERRLRGTVWRGRPVAWLYEQTIALGATLGKLGVSADAMTYLSLALATLAGVLAAVSEFGWTALAVVLSGICDILDGTIARAMRTSSRYGALLDSAVDRLADGLPLLGLVVAFSGKRLLPAIPCFAAFTSFLVPYVRARAEGLGVTLPPLFMRRAERMVMLIACLGVAELSPGAMQSPLLLSGVGAMGLLSLWATLAAVRAARSALAAGET